MILTPSSCAECRFSTDKMPGTREFLLKKGGEPDAERKIIWCQLHLKKISKTDLCGCGIVKDVEVEARVFSSVREVLGGRATMPLSFRRKRGE